jgi:cell division protease FtsH
MSDNGGWNPLKPPQGDKPTQSQGPQWKNTLLIMVAILVGVLLLNYFVLGRQDNYIDYSAFKQKVASGDIGRVEINGEVLTGYTKAKRPVTNPITGQTGSASNVFNCIGVADKDFVALLDSKGVAYAAKSQQGDAILNFFMTWVLPFVLLFFLWRFFAKRMGNMGSGVLSFGQNRATVVAEGDVKTTFNDVAGADEAKEELVEVVDFLKNPRKYTDIGGKIPKGVLLVGPPGTGKTLLARAVAGEAGVPFFRMSGADFVEMFVGVGASRVRDLFQKAREKAPCIVFIDELDAIGKSRINALGGNDEREQTLNQLLVEMDGFAPTTGLILLGATNRPDVLDPALLRPGRFDRQVLVDRPDLKGREAILRIHSKGVKIAPQVDLAAVARGTPGFAGADLANIVNEAALLAVRAGRKQVEQVDFEEAVEKVIAGLQKKSRIISPKERNVVAVHETGHALVAGLTPGADAVRKISIIPRGFGALGYTLQMPQEDKYLMTELELRGEIDVLLGGRAAEEIVFSEISTGAASDLQKATDVVRSMITEYGMSERFRHVALSQKGSPFMRGGAAEPSFQREYSENTQSYIDEEIARVIGERYATVRALLESRRDLLDSVAKVLLEKETIDEAEFKAMLAGTKAGAESPSDSPKAETVSQ